MITLEEYKDRVKNVPGLNFVGPFVNMTTKTYFKCCDCGSLYLQPPYEAVKKKIVRCRNCSRSYAHRNSKISESEFRNRINITTVSPYNGYNKQIKVLCNKCKKEFISTPSSLVSDNPRGLCYSCSHKRVDLEERFKSQVSKDFELIRIYKSGTKVKVTYKCKRCGEQHTSDYYNFLSSQVCKNERYIISSKNYKESIKNKYNSHWFYNKIKELPWSSDYEFIGTYVDYSTPIKCLHKKCGLISEIVPDYFLRKGYDWTYCRLCRPIGSKAELELLDFVKNLGISAHKLPKGSISYYELDIFIPELNIGFDFNGCYWHCIRSDRPRFNSKYHENKTNMFLNKGIKVYHLWDYWGIEMCKSIIKAKLNMLPKIYARNTIVKPIDRYLAEDFLKSNHIHGYKNSSIHLGLFYKNTLVSVMTFTKDSLGWELSRFASDMNIVVVGGFSKLLFYMWKNYPINKIITYAYRDLNPDYKDTVYYHNDFTFIKSCGPSMYYWNMKENKVEMRRKYQKLELKKNYPNVYSDTKTEKQICEELGLYQIYDSGVFKFEMCKPLS